MKVEVVEVTNTFVRKSLFVAPTLVSLALPPWILGRGQPIEWATSSPT
jgi:hypothetical protein